MAKPNTNQPKHPKQENAAKQALLEKRARNHSPAIERRREENAYHTNPLAPIPNKVLRSQAQHLIGQFYKPGFEQLNNEEKRVKSISEKRKADNTYYLNWLNQQSELLHAHDEAARTQLLAAGQQVQADVQKGWEAVSPGVQAGVEAQPGVSTSATQSGEPSLLSAAAAKGTADVANARQATIDQIGTTENAERLNPAINMAQIAAMESRRQADLNENLTGIRNSRQELRGQRGSKAAEFFQQAQDKEIEKAQARAQIAASEATAAIEAKRFGLDAAKAKLEGSEFEFEKGYKNRKLGLENRELKQKSEENRIHTELEEGKITQTEAKIAIEKAKLKNEGKKIENEGQQTPAEKAKAAEKQKQLNNGIDTKINTAATYIHGNPKLRKLAHSNPAKLKEILVNKVGYSPIAVQVAIEMYLHGHISDATKKALEQAGYTGTKLGA